VNRPGPSPLDPEQVAAATLACLPEMTPNRLRAILDAFGDTVHALDAVIRGHVAGTVRAVTRPHLQDAIDPLTRLWSAVARDDQLPALLARRGTHVHVEGRADWPFRDMPDAPAVLLAEGAAPDALSRPRVAVVGTRAATPHGLADAYELGGHLAEGGCTVVSGLAIGIDGAAHEGALDAGGTAVGVVGTGLDVVYPRRHRVLFERVRDQGLIVSELGYGVGPRKAAFPIRNRIIAGLADVVVVVEATERGGARITADRAIDYGRQVFAMPGSRRNPASVGANQLLYDGALPLLQPSDVFVQLGLTQGARHAARPQPGGDEGRVLRACCGEPTTLDELTSRTGIDVRALVGIVRTLERDRWLTRKDGLYWPMT